MAAKNYQLNITKSDGTSETVSFAVPDIEGTYKLKFTLSNGEEIDAGNITVDDAEHLYDLKLTLSDGSTINAGTIVTPIVLPTFAETTWSEIAAISEAGNASSAFAVGDEKTITLSTGEEVTLVILGFDHDDLSDGSGKAGITIGMKNLLTESYQMNEDWSNAGGWDESKMRTVTMPTLLSQLPSDLQNVIKQVNKKATAGRRIGNITTSVDKLWLLAMAEVFSYTSIGNSSALNISNNSYYYIKEGAQYEYYENLIGDNNGGTNANSLLSKKMANGSGSAGRWWLRSPSMNSEARFHDIDSTGLISTNGAAASSNYAVSFCFCV